jgi:two-component system response regulator RegA
VTARTSPLRILLVDDDNGYRLTSAALLEDEGFFIETAGSLAEGKLLLASGKRFDLVLLDYHLQDGSGLDLIPLIRAETPGTKVVLVSGEGASASFPALDGVVTKGGSFRDFLSLLHRLFR